MKKRIVDIVNNQLIEDCSIISLYANFAPNDDTLSGFGIYKSRNCQKHLYERIPMNEVEESNLKKWMMIGTGYRIRIQNNLEHYGFVTAIAEFDDEKLLNFTAPTLEGALECLQTEMNGFDFEGLHTLFVSSDHSWYEAAQKTKILCSKLGRQ